MSAHEVEIDDASRLLAKPRARVFVWRALATVALLALVLSRVPAGALADSLRRVPPGLWLFAIAGFLAGHLVGAGKWRLLVAAAGARPDARESVRAHAAGLFANLCLPSLVGGDVVRAALLLRDGHPAAPVALGSIADRWIDTASVVTIASAGALSMPGAIDPTSRRVLVASALLLAGSVFAALLASRLVDPRRLPARVASLLARTRDAFDALRTRPLVVVVAFGISCAVQSSFVGISLALGRAVGIELPASVWLLASPLAKLTALLPVSLGGLGVREAAFVVLLAPFGVEASAAIAQSLLWQGVLVAGGLVAGLGALALGARVRQRRGISSARLRHATGDDAGGRRP